MEKSSTLPSCLKLEGSGLVNSTSNVIFASPGNIPTKKIVFRPHYVALLRMASLLLLISTMAFKSFATVTPITTSACVGAVDVCLGGTTTLTDTTAGGTWSSGNTAIATIDPTTGILTGVAIGTTVISYTTATSGTATTIVKVNNIPTEMPITGIMEGCAGSTLALSDGTSGGEWFSSNSSIATINSSGVVTCVSDGVVSINYAVFNSCGINEQFAYITVGPSPINGTTAICAGTSSVLSDTSAGGTWSSGNTAIASINPVSGNLTGVAAGICIITYTILSGCMRMVTVNVIAAPQTSSITGPGIVTVGAAITLSNAVSGGIWSSKSTSLATINSGGIVAGLSAGVDTVSYSVSNSCSTSVVTYPVTVSNVYPITGSLALCSGNSTALSDATAGGSWSSSNTSVATVGSGTGIVTAVATGTAMISYITAIGTVTAMVTVSSAPSDMPITGTMVACAGSTLTLTDATPGGTWFCSDNTIATISNTGVVTCLDSGIVSINYIVFNGCGVNEQFARVTVQQHSPINGATNICTGASTTLTNANAGGTWSSSTTAVATINSSTGRLTGVTGGTSVISYTIPTGCGSTVTVNVTAHPATSPITGPTSVTVGSTSTLSDAVSGGTWSSRSTSLATINSSGVVTGVSAGVDTISYSVSNSCFTSAVTYTVVVNNISIAPISGTLTVCSGSSTTLSDATAGGSWSSNNTSVATISSTGVVTGTGVGTATITYRILTSFITTSVTVNPVPGIITGTGIVCAGATTSLTDAGGGAWSSNNTAVATIDATGIVTGAVAGNATISYSLTGCVATTAVTVNALPSAILGLATECAGTTITVSDATTGGTWSSSNTAAVTIDASGNIMGVSAGAATISYRLVNGCYTTYSNTVLANPSAITGTGVVCVGSVTILNDTTSGALSYTSGNVSVATVTNSGQVTGVSAGTAIITYAIISGCITTTVTTVNGLPGAITGNTAVCIGATITLNDPAGAGAWSSNNTAIATVDPVSGIVTGIASGTATITYTAATGCMITAVTTVNAAIPISGNNMICVGSTTTLSDATGAGTWISGNAGIATIDLNTGVLTGMSSGIAIVTYQGTSGCPATIMVTINPAATISGNFSICSATTTVLGDAVAGGAWSSSNTLIATIDVSSGTVTASTFNTGTATISYTTGSCGVSTQIITVNQSPLSIQGGTLECAGTTINISDATAGGAWTSSNGNATVDGSGNVTGMNAGAATISYMLPDGCYSTYSNTIVANPPAITGTNVCIGSTATLSDATTGGIWSSSNTASATVGSNTGIVTGSAIGTTTITYKIPAGCITTMTLTVNSLPGAITGNAQMCGGSTITLSDPAGPGTWSSNNTGIATVGSSSGVVTGIAGNTTTITYFAGTTGCKATITVSVNPILPISGTSFVCVGSSATLSDASAGGTWSSSNTGIATIGATGLVTGISVGSVTITYRLASGCNRTTTIGVGTVSAMLGTSAVCANGTITMSDTTSGGAWSLSGTAIATIGSATGTVTASGTLTGTATISYSIGSCAATRVLTVNGNPSGILGTSSECVGATTTLTDATAGGTWSSAGDASIGTPSTGIVTGGSAAGTATITYMLATGCYVTSLNTIHSNPSAIMGTFTVCPGGMTMLSDTTAGAISWLSGNGSIAIAVNSGQVTGVAAGTAIITYKILTGSCIATQVVTVVPSPAAITGTRIVCTGAATSLFDTSGSGTWSSGNVALATVGSAIGIVVGVSPGSPIIAFTLASTGCKITAAVTVNAIPNAGSLSGPLTVAIGSNITLASSGTAGGTWSTSNSNATVGPTGIVTGAAAGTCTITYSVGNACGFSGAYKTITITTPGGRMAGGATSSDSSTILLVNPASLLDNVLSGSWNGITTADDNGLGAKTNPTSAVASPASLSLLPNPNKGAFTVKGTVGSFEDEEVTLGVTDVSGQVIYWKKVTAQGGKLNETITLNNVLANGIYLLEVRSKTENKVFHFVISK